MDCRIGNKANEKMRSQRSVLPLLLGRGVFLGDGCMDLFST